MPTLTTTSTELVQNLYAAFGRGDIATVLSFIDPDCQWVIPGEGSPIYGTYQGPSGVARFFQLLNESEEMLRFEPKEFFVNGDDVIALGFLQARIRATGKTTQTNWTMLFRFRNQKVAYYEMFADTAAQLAAYA
jgi:ketosteroid isomerase-like protein